MSGRIGQRTCVLGVIAGFGVALGAPPSASAACRTIAYTPPGLTPAQHGDYCTARSGRAREAVVVVHGGGGVRGDRRRLAGFARLLRRGGKTSTLTIDYTLLASGDPGPLYPRPERDVKLAVQWLRAKAARTLTDTRRVFVLGHSAGARLGAQALISPDEPFFYSGGPTWGMSDRIAGFIGFAGPYSGRLVVPDFDRRYYGGPPDSPDAAVQDLRRRADSTAAAARASGPALLVHGTRDRNVPIAESERFVAALRKANRPVTFVRVVGAAHQPTPAQGRAYAKRVVTWLGRVE